MGRSLAAGLQQRLQRLNYLGLVLGALFLAASMTPSLIPRHWLFQGLVSGIVAAAGYGLGTTASYLSRRLSSREPSPWVKRVAWSVLAVTVPAAVVVMTILGIGWQRELHSLMDMPVPSAWGYVVALPFALILAMGLVMIARGVRWINHKITALFARLVPRPVAGVLAGVVVALLIVGLLDGVVGRAFFATADQTFRLSDQIVDDELAPPADPLRSGSDGSLVAWGDLGSQGRSFVAGGPSEQALEEFSRGPVTAPIRVYAGLTSEADVPQRAALVVRELERTGAFERSVLCVMTATGTGWIDPEAASALEYLWAGDTALATMQYSYLPSWLSFLVDQGRAREAGEELFNAVYERWAMLPEGNRPLLLVFGASLGADGSEAAFSGIADVRNRTDGALWAGPPHFSELWSSFVERRDPGSPQHLPVYDGGATVRFASAPEDLLHPDAPWYRPRVVYLQNASDPIVWWTPRLILRRPPWLVEGRGPDVLPAMRWYPLVTFWQLTADMAGAARVPPGHAHEYETIFADAWAAIAAPPGWSQSDTKRLRAVVAEEAAAVDR